MGSMLDMAPPGKVAAKPMSPPAPTDPGPVRTVAPARIDLAGGTLDIWPLYLLVPGAVTVNLAVSRLARASVALRRDGRIRLRSRDTGDRVQQNLRDRVWDGDALPLLREIVEVFRPAVGFDLSTRSAVPPGSGLGGSSALAVAVLRALSIALEVPLSRDEILPLARDVEAKVIGVPTGLQDHFAAAYGGLSALHLRPGAPEREVVPGGADPLTRRLLLVLVGASRLSARTNWAMLRGAVDGDPEIRERFLEIAAAAREMRSALLGRDIDRAAAAMQREYRARRGL
ncbi:MAG: hypothetical protein GF328_15725, partial [Candidatus Latescibacteria bacterium]|nr:hypothetical protein [Candidatus Latescibacterota bacterium]